MANLGVSAFLRRAIAAITGARRDRELGEEIDGHIEMRRLRLIEDGLDPREAAREARRMFGNAAVIREETRDMRGFPAIDTLTQDLRYGLRMMARSPGFSAVAVVSLVVSIGLSSVLFSVANTFLFRPLPGTRASELMQVFTSNSRGGPEGATSYADYEDVRDRSGVFSGVLAFRRARASQSDGGQRGMLHGALVSANYFDVLGLRPSQGRFFRAEENAVPGRDPVVVLSHDGWRNNFASDPQVVGRAVRLNGHAFTVVGVGPPRFAGVSLDDGADFFVPAMMEAIISPGDPTLGERGYRAYRVLGCLRPEMSQAQAQASLRLLAAQLALQYPGAWRTPSGRDRTLTVLPEIDARFAGAAEGATLFIFASVMAGVVLLLAVACVNVATVLLARAAGRRKEIAIRLAMGASRRRVIRQLLTECAVLAALGGAGGLVLASWGAAAFARWRPAEAPGFDLSLDLRVLLFTIGAALLTILFFGLAPALQTTRADVNAELKDREPALAVRRFRIRLRDGLVIVQVGVSVVLVVGALLMLRSARLGRAQDPGFRREGVLTVDIDLSTIAPGDNARTRFYRAAVEAVTAIPGVERAALATIVPLDGSNMTTDIEVRAGAAVTRGVVDFNIVGAGYFSLLGIQLMQGREFAASDREGSPRVAVVNETMARMVWQGSAIGQTFGQGEKRVPYEVVGIVRDVRHRSFSESVLPMAFFPAGQQPSTRMSLHVLTAGPPQQLGEAIQRALHAIDPAAGVGTARTMTQYMDFVTMPQRLGGAAAAAAAGLELALAMMALYGVIAYSTTRRLREIGIRLALGAPSRSVARLIMRDGLLLGGIGVALGTVVALVAAPAAGSLLIGVGPTDPVSFGFAAALLLSVAAAASYLPARRALRVDPTVALRAE